MAWDTEKQQILPFQILSTRKRKVCAHQHSYHTHTSYVGTYWPLQDADVSNINIQVCVYAFDLLYLNGKVSNVYNLYTAVNDCCHLVVIGEGAFSGET